MENYRSQFQAQAMHQQSIVNMPNMHGILMLDRPFDSSHYATRAWQLDQSKKEKEKEEEMLNMKMYRQGDVLLIELNSWSSEKKGKPQERDAQGRLVLEYGEVTGHAHAIKSKEASLVTMNSGLRLLETYADVELTHEEHDPIQLPAKKVYEVRRQREYKHGIIRNVAD